MPVPLVTPLSGDANPEVAALATFFNETLGFCPNSVLTMQHRPALATAFIELNKAAGGRQSASYRIVRQDWAGQAPLQDTFTLVTHLGSCEKNVTVNYIYPL